MRYSTRLDIEYPTENLIYDKESVTLLYWGKQTTWTAVVYLLGVDLETLVHSLFQSHNKTFQKLLLKSITQK